jgi:hypothetical protein
VPSVYTCYRCTAKLRSPPDGQEASTRFYGRKVRERTTRPVGDPRPRPMIATG